MVGERSSCQEILDCLLREVIVCRLPCYVFFPDVIQFLPERQFLLYHKIDSLKTVVPADAVPDMFVVLLQ